MTKLSVIIGCEFSGVVRDEFLKLGHDAVSCDLLPSERPGPHIIGDARDVARRGRYDIGVFHPPCTYSANSGAKWLYVGGRKENGRDETRWWLMKQGARFLRELWELDIEHMAIEQPIIHQHAAAIIGVPVTQIIQPWQFGHGETKATCLRLRGLPKLVPTEIVAGREPRVHHASPGANRWRERSRTLTGIARAMAEQWSNL